MIQNHYTFVDATIHFTLRVEREDRLKSFCAIQEMRRFVTHFRGLYI